MLALVCLGHADAARPKASAGGAPLTAGPAAGGRKATVASGASSAPLPVGGQASKSVEDPSLFKIQKVKGTFDQHALGSFRAKPAPGANAAARNWKAPKRSFKLKELASKANTQKNTKSEAKTGVRAPKPSGPRSKPAKTGAIPRPKGGKAKFNPAAKYNQNVLAFGRGTPVKAGKGSAAAAAAAPAGPAGKPSRGARGAGAAAAAAGTAAGASRRGKKSMFVELSSVEAPTAGPKLIAPVIEVGTQGLPELSETTPDLSQLAPCPSNSSSASFLELGADEVEPVMIEAHVDTVTVVQSAAHSLVEADVVGELAAGDLKLPSGLVVTAAQIVAITAAFAKQTSDRVWYHWADYQASIRWGRARKVDAGEVGWLNTQNNGMAAGGGQIRHRHMGGGWKRREGGALVVAVRLSHRDVSFRLSARFLFALHWRRLLPRPGSERQPWVRPSPLLHLHQGWPPDDGHQPGSDCGRPRERALAGR